MIIPICTRDYRFKVSYIKKYHAKGSREAVLGPFVISHFRRLPYYVAAILSLFTYLWYLRGESFKIKLGTKFITA